MEKVIVMMLSNFVTFSAHHLGLSAGLCKFDFRLSRDLCDDNIKITKSEVLSHTDSEPLHPEPSVSVDLGLETSTEWEPDVARIFNDDK
jgi:hypothetical protein